MTEQTVSLIEKLEAEKIQCSSSIANNDIVIKCHNEAIDMCCEIIRQHQAEQPDDVVEQMFNEVMPEVKFITIPPPDTLNDCRTAFEEWAAAYPLWLSKQANGSYVREATETAWDSWQAAWNLRNGVSSEMWQTADGRPIFGVGSPHDIEKHIDAIVAEPSEISVVDGFDIEKARKDLKPEAWELLKQPVVQSLLYDINLLPEQIKTGKHWFYMLSVLSHMDNALKWESIDVLKGANSPQLEIMKDALIKIAAPLSPSPDEEDGTPTYTMVIDDYTKRVAIARQVLSDIEGGAL